jgi:CrcB protein
MERFVWICVGGAAGTGLRYLASGWMLRALGPAFPYGTLAVNVVGSLVLGLLMHLGMTTEWMSPTLRLALTTGLMGGLTTYSTFSFETMRLIEEGAWGLALLNVALTLFVCLGASFGGVLLGRLIAGS